MQYAVQGFQQTTFFYGNSDYYALSLGLTPFLDRDDSIATRTITGGTLFAPYPLSRYTRIEMSAGSMNWRIGRSGRLTTRLLNGRMPTRCRSSSTTKTW